MFEIVGGIILAILLFPVALWLLAQVVKVVLVIAFSPAMVVMWIVSAWQALRRFWCRHLP